MTATPNQALRRTAPGGRAHWKRSASDSLLGELVLSDDADWWERTVKIDGRSVQFQVSGDHKPSPALISHAHGIVCDFSTFSHSVTEFLAAAASAQPPATDEIRQLTLKSVCLFWPERPNDGMLYIHGPDEYRVWRCDYIDRKPQGLVFDS